MSSPPVRQSQWQPLRLFNTIGGSLFRPPPSVDQRATRPQMPTTPGTQDQSLHLQPNGRRSRKSGSTRRSDQWGVAVPKRNRAGIRTVGCRVQAQGTTKVRERGGFRAAARANRTGQTTACILQYHRRTPYPVIFGDSHFSVPRRPKASTKRAHRSFDRC